MPPVRPLAALLTLLALLTLFAAPPMAAAESAKPPHVVLVMSDDQGWGDVGFAGHPFARTPHLDAMAANGLRFTRFYAAAPVCSPTRASVLAGRHPNRSGVVDHGRHMRPEEETVAAVLRRAGYVTAHFGKWHVGSVLRDHPTSPAGRGFDEWISAPNYFDYDPHLSDNGVARSFAGESSQLVVDWTLDFLKRRGADGKPLFAVVWFAAPHDPHVSRPPDDALYAGEKLAGYYREITAMDREIGRLRQGLRDLGIANDTLLWFCSDNGGLNPATSGGRDKKGTVWEGGLRVPAIVEWPAAVKPGVADAPAFTSDLLPTIVEIAGAARAASHPLDGVSLARLLRGDSSFSRPPMGFWRMPRDGHSTHSDAIVKEILRAQAAGIAPDVQNPPFPGADHPIDSFPGHAAWLDFPWKLHRLQADDDGAARYELYHLVNDPMESKPLLQPLAAARGKTMRAQLDAWLASVAGSLNGDDYR